MAGRTHAQDLYRFGYQGSEFDYEINNDKNIYSTEFRILDVRLGRWLTIDPKSRSFPQESPYNSMLNNPLTGNDIKGDSLNAKFSNYAKDSQTEKAFKYLLSTKEGYDYLSKFAAKGQTVCGVTFAEDGEYHKKGMDLTYKFFEFTPQEISSGAWKNKENGLTEPNLKWGFDRSKVTVYINNFTNMDNLPKQSESILNNALATGGLTKMDDALIFLKLKTIVHETFIHVDQSVKSLLNLPGKAGVTIGYEADHIWEDTQAKEKKSTKFNTDGFNILKRYNEEKKLGGTSDDVWFIMWNFSY